MGLNISKGNMYSFITHTWNTVKGKCFHDCSYCYMKRWGNLKDIRFDEKELKTDLGTGNFIFIGSSCDMFADNIPMHWIEPTVLMTYRFKENKYFYQTKDPENLLDFVRSGLNLFNASICTTIETNRYYPSIMGKAPRPYRRSDAMREIHSDGYKTYVTVEPIIEFGLSELVELIDECRPTQVNIGADSGNNHLPEPSSNQIVELIEALSEFTTVHQKPNLKRLLK